jgi:hypothetical protein
MSEKSKTSDMDPSDAAGQQTRRQQPGAQGAGKDADAIQPSGDVDESKLKENREKRLNVGDDHKTPEMNKGHRGTFP